MVQKSNFRNGRQLFRLNFDHKSEAFLVQNGPEMFHFEAMKVVFSCQKYIIFENAEPGIVMKSHFLASILKSKMTPKWCDFEVYFDLKMGPKWTDFGGSNLS